MARCVSADCGFLHPVPTRAPGPLLVDPLWIGVKVQAEGKSGSKSDTLRGMCSASGIFRSPLVLPPIQVSPLKHKGSDQLVVDLGVNLAAHRKQLVFVNGWEWVL